MEERAGANTPAPKPAFRLPLAGHLPASYPDAPVARRDTARWAGPGRGVGGGSAQQPRGSATIAEVPLLPQTLASRPPRSAASRHAGSRSPPPSPRLVPSRAPHLVSASFSLLVEGKRKKKSHPPPVGAPRPLGGKKQHKTRHGPGLPLLKAWPTRGGRGPGREAPQRPPPPTASRPRGPAPSAPRPPPSLRRRPPRPPSPSQHFPRSRAATPLIDGVAPEGKVSVPSCPRRAAGCPPPPLVPGSGCSGRAGAESKGWEWRREVGEPRAGRWPQCCAGQVTVFPACLPTPALSGLLRHALLLV